METYSVIDIGSNTIRLVIYRLAEGMPRAILNSKRAAGLAGYVDGEGRLSAEGVEKLLQVLAEFRLALDLIPECRVYPFATASLRNIRNTQEVLDAVRARCGMEVQVLSGFEEASLDFRGAGSVLSAESGLVTDVGGGSTQLVFFREGRIQTAVSLPWGSLNLYRRFCQGLFPTARELAAMEREVEQSLRQALPGAAYPAEPVFTIGGTARAILELYRRWEPGREKENVYSTSFFDQLLQRCAQKPKKLLRQILSQSPDRVHTLLPGAAVLHTLSRCCGCRTVHTSPFGVREGYLDYMLEKEGLRHG